MYVFSRGNELKKVRIGHDNKGLGPAWFLEKVRGQNIFIVFYHVTMLCIVFTISDFSLSFTCDFLCPQVTVEDETCGKVYVFPCYRWLAKNEDDGQITRELLCNNDSEQDNTYITPGTSSYQGNMHIASRILLFGSTRVLLSFLKDVNDLYYC